MIVYDATAAGRRGRLYSQAALPVDVIAAEFAASFDEAEDGARDAVLRSILGSRNVVAVTHRGIEPADVIKVFFRRHLVGRSEKVFACVLVSASRLEQMVEEAATVVEGHDLAVATTRGITNSSICAALEAWTERNYPGIPLPRFSLDPWRGEVDASPGPALALLRLRGSMGVAQRPAAIIGEHTPEFRPESNLTDDSTRESAA